MTTANAENVIDSVKFLGIDCLTASKAKLIALLEAEESTVAVYDGGKYREDESNSQVLIDTTMTEAELEDWLYTTPGALYIGVFKRN